ncbi:MAG: hypothetical protein QG608_3024 [Actinomycetota bacterium]|nr:hypothetical protein [Actinomycetota bacterium]
MTSVPDRKVHCRRPPVSGRRPVRAVFGAFATALVLFQPLGGQTQASAGEARARTGRTFVQTANGSGLPPGWSLSAEGDRLAWRSSRPLTVFGARIELHADGRVLPRTEVSSDLRSVSADLAGTGIEDPSTLRAVAGGRRLDTPSRPADRPERPARRTAGTIADAPAPGTATGTLSGTTSGTMAGSEPDQPTLPEESDPGRPGPYTTRTGEYRLADLPIPDLQSPVEMLAQVVSPVGATGRRPVALFLHGRHFTCHNPASPADRSSFFVWPCPQGHLPIPSYHGFARAQELLASQGWITVSVSANGISAQDNLPDGGAAARSELLLAHLGRWAAWSSSEALWAQSPKIVRTGPRADLERVLLVGHSRGGEGANRAALDSTTLQSVPWNIRGQVLIAPTARGRNPAPGVPTAVILPACDGDVSDLEGQYYLDAARDVAPDRVLRSAVFVEGANHNYFNTEWTPGTSQGPAYDDWWNDVDPSDPACGFRSTSRLSGAAQSTVGAVYTAAAGQVFVLDRAEVAPLLDGTPVRAASAGPVRVLTHALGGNRRPLLVPTPDTTVQAGPGTSIDRCATARDSGDDSCVPDDFSWKTPSFGPFTWAQDEPTRTALRVAWTEPGAVAGAVLRPGPSQAGPPQAGTPQGGLLEAGTTALALRVAVPPAARDTRFAVRLVDADGQVARVGSVDLDGLPSRSTRTGTVGRYWAQEVRLAVSREALRAVGADPDRLTRLEILPESAAGRLWLLDAWTYQPGPVRDGPVRLPRFDVDDLTVAGRESGGTVNLPVRITGEVRETSTVWFALTEPDGTVRSLTTASIAPGTTVFDLHVPIEEPAGPTDDPLRYEVIGLGMRGIVGGSVHGGLTVRNEPAEDSEGFPPG